MANEAGSQQEDGRQGVDNFRALLKGHIDIFQYLNSDHASASDHRLDQDVGTEAFKAESDMDTEVIMAYGQHHQGQRIPLVQSLSSGNSAKRPPSYRGNPYGNGPLRLPESPPETDSGAGSAGSPSGSDGSPYSPEYQNYNGSVIMHPSGINPVPNAVEVAQPGVILDVHSLDNLSHPAVSEYIGAHTDRVGMGDLVNSQMSNPNFYPSPSPSVVHSPSVSSSYPSYSLPPPRAHPSYVADPSLPRKRTRTDVPILKNEPLASPLSTIGEEGYFEESTSHQAIRFSEFETDHWHKLCDANGRELSHIGLHVVADKGFNFSQFDTAFVNQKKNHFQISVHIEVRDRQAPKFVKVQHESGVTLKPIAEFQLDFYGVKTEMPSSIVQIKQSQTDRKPIAYESVKLDLPPNRVTKVTVARLHFSETTMNNQRKNGRPNPDQKYFYLVVALNAITTGNEKLTILAFNSEKVIVRASNPGQFDNGENETHWQKGQVGNSIFHPGPVGIGTDRPTAALTVSGDVSCTGSLYHPSDARLKENVKEVNCAEALSRLSQIRIVQYEIRPEVKQQWNLPPERCPRVGVIAQEVNDVLPDAVKNNGDFLTVDDSRIFYESAAAVKELCRLTGNLEYKIEEVEKISKKLSKINKLKRFDSLRSSLSANTFSGGSCAGSFLSCSLTSVLSGSRNGGTKEPKEDDNKWRESRACRYHKRYCSRLAIDRGLCSNKIIQATIVVLVLVMAFCLISMATLYVLDWHKRNVFRSRDILSISLPNRLTKEFERKEDHGGRPDPGLMSLPITTASITGSKANSQISPDLAPTPPPLNPCNRLPCEQFCCPNSYSSYLADTGSLSDGPAIFLMQNRNASPVGADFHPNSAHLLRMSNAFSQAKQFSRESSGIRDYMPFLLMPMSFKILNLNVTIDSQYCFGNACDDPRRGNFTYAVPVSMYMPHIPLEVQFILSGKEQMHFCSQEAGEFCHGIEPNFAESKIGHGPEGELGFLTSVQQRQFDTWELPVGAYVLSAYKFRIGPSTSLCLLPNDEAGSSFVEYNLIFYRVCAE
ncbi:hypothetical protein M514_00539 [Trichuris suis]|uniref:NDT80 domain-containing protein n=1 Tax=Trichuris suis TaxID=68888 RepID=A0A085MM67_9BILA|nr:hypothetical protein M513_00539 [Trichuris suis]KFD67476.1 hypothetical protein M514_00539 [Trichuris suis]